MTRIRRIIPNLITSIAVFLGILSLLSLFKGDYERSAMLIIVACLVDGVDGRAARALRVASPFGAELDSLADFFNFGVVPAFFIYFWKTSVLGNISIIAMTIFVLAVAFRLARFNIMIGLQENAGWMQRHFSGVPSPGAAALVLLPFIFYTETDGYFVIEPLHMLWFNILLSIVVVSPIPTLSMKNVKIPKYFMVPFLLLLIAIVGLIFLDFWFASIVLVSLYGGSIVFSVLSFLFMYVYKKI